jgi:hypothetical protein
MLKTQRRLRLVVLFELPDPGGMECESHAQSYLKDVTPLIFEATVEQLLVLTRPPSPLRFSLRMDAATSQTHMHIQQ